MKTITKASLNNQIHALNQVFNLTIPMLTDDDVLLCDCKAQLDYLNAVIECNLKCKKALVGLVEDIQLFKNKMECYQAFDSLMTEVEEV